VLSCVLVHDTKELNARAGSRNLAMAHNLSVAAEACYTEMWQAWLADVFDKANDHATALLSITRGLEQVQPKHADLLTYRADAHHVQGRINGARSGLCTRR